MVIQILGWSESKLEEMLQEKLKLSSLIIYVNLITFCLNIHWSTLWDKQSAVKPAGSRFSLCCTSYILSLLVLAIS